MQPRLGGGPLDFWRLRPLAPKSQSERAQRVGSSRGRAGRGAGQPRVLKGGAAAGGMGGAWAERLAPAGLAAGSLGPQRGWAGAGETFSTSLWPREV